MTSDLIAKVGELNRILDLKDLRDMKPIEILEMLASSQYKYELPLRILWSQCCDMIFNPSQHLKGFKKIIVFSHLKDEDMDIASKKLPLTMNILPGGFPHPMVEQSMLSLFNSYVSDNNVDCIYLGDIQLNDSGRITIKCIEKSGKAYELTAPIRSAAGESFVDEDKVKFQDIHVETTGVLPWETDSQKELIKKVSTASPHTIKVLKPDMLMDCENCEKKDICPDYKGGDTEDEN